MLPANRLSWRFVLVAAFLFAAVLVRCYYYRPYFGIDDSNIGQVYSHNLVEGHGWRYSPSTERVEGTTSFLYTLIWAAAFLTPAPHLLMHVFNFLCCLAACWWGLRILDLIRSPGEEAGGWWPSTIAYLLWLAVTPGIITWTTVTLMDSSPWTALIVGSVWLLCRLARDQDYGWYARRMAIAAALTVPMRPESLAMVPLFVAIGFAILYTARRDLRIAVRWSALPALSYVVTAGALTLFRLSYFGYPVPNTYYAKVSTYWLYNLRNGVIYVIKANGAAWFLAPAAAGALVFGARAAILLWRREGKAASHWATVACTAPALAMLGIAVLNGGDHFMQGRFLAQALMLLPLPALARVDWRAGEKFGSKAAAAAALPAIPLLAGISYAAVYTVEPRNDVEHEFTVATFGMQMGEMLNDAFPGEKPSVGVVTAGGIARTYDGYVFDMLGLNSTKIAHSDRHRTGLKNHAAFSRKVFYETLPGVVAPRVIGGDAPMSASAFNDSVTHEVFYEPEFREKYAHMELRLRQRTREWKMLNLPTSAAGRWMAPRPEPAAGLDVFVLRTLVDRINRDVFDAQMTEYKEAK